MKLTAHLNSSYYSMSAEKVSGHHQLQNKIGDEIRKGRSWLQGLTEISA